MGLSRRKLDWVQRDWEYEKSGISFVGKPFECDSKKGAASYTLTKDSQKITRRIYFCGLSLELMDVLACYFGIEFK